MKTPYLAVIAVLLFSMFPSVHGISGTAFFMKTNSTSKIYANFTFPVPNNKTWNLSPRIYLLSTTSQVQADSNNMTITPDPNSFKAGKDNVTVTYTITAKNNTKGVFALFLYFCGETPLIVGLNESEVSPDIYKQFFTAGYSCPAMFDFTPNMSLIGYSNLLYKRINIDSNNTIKSVQTEGQFTNNTTLKNSTNQIPPIPYSILRSASPTLTPSETRSLVKIALDIPELQKWSHDWHYVDMGFLGNNKLATGGFEWQYAIVDLKAPSSSAPMPCDNDWWAWIEIDMTTMKVVKVTYPTMESHQCQVAMGGGPGTSGNIMPVIKSPLQQFKSGIYLENIQCEKPLILFFKTEDHSPVCLTIGTADVLSRRNVIDTSDNTTLDIAKKKARDFILSSITFETFGLKSSLVLDQDAVCLLTFPEDCLIKASFEGTGPGYGNGTNSLSQTKTLHHAMAVRINDTNNVMCAVIDGIWDEKNQKPLDKSDGLCGYLYGLKGGLP